MNVEEEQRKEKQLTLQLNELKKQILQTTNNSKKIEGELDQELFKLATKIEEQENQKQKLAQKIETLQQNETKYLSDIEQLSKARQNMQLKIDDEQKINGNSLLIRIQLEKIYDQLNVEEEIKNEGRSVLIKLKGVVNDQIEEFKQEIGLLKKRICRFQRNGIENYLYMKNINKHHSQDIIPKRTLKSSSLKKKFSLREQGWNNRIIISEQILGVVPKQQSKNTKLPFINCGTASIVQKYIQMHNEQQEEESLKESEQKIFATKLEQVKSFHKLYNIPKVHQNLFNQLLVASNDKMIILEEELKLLDQKLSPIQHCMFTITARENCLTKLENSLNQQDKQLILQLINDYRILSLNALESIIKWQQYFEHKNIQAHFKLDENTFYHERFYSDYQTLKPELEKLFTLSDACDPFFIKLLGGNQHRLSTRIRRAETELLNLIVNYNYLK